MKNKLSFQTRYRTNKMATCSFGRVSNAVAGVCVCVCHFLILIHIVVKLEVIAGIWRISIEISHNVRLHEIYKIFAT